MLKLIEKNGQWFKCDEKSEVLKDAEGKDIVATEEEVKAFKESQKPPVDPTKATLEELAKVNPEVAKFIQEQREREAKATENERKRQEDEDKKKRESGNFQQLFEETDKKLKEAEGKNLELQNIVGKYKKSTEELLADAIAQIPEDKRSLIPGDYSPLKKLEYIRNNSAIFGVSLIKGSNVPPNENKPPLNEEMQLQKEYDELMAKPNRTFTENQIMTEKARKLKEIKAAKGTQ